MKRYLALLLSVVMMVTFMPTMAFAADGDGGEEYFVDLFLENGQDETVLSPGMTETLRAQVFVQGDDEATPPEATFELIERENNCFDDDDDDDDENEPIVEVDENDDGTWTATALKVKDGDDCYKPGCAIYQVKATLENGTELFSCEKAISVESNIGFQPDVQKDHEEKYVTDVDLNEYIDEEPSAVIFTTKPYCRPASDIEFEYEFELGQYRDDGEFHEFDVEKHPYPTVDEDFTLHLTKEYINGIMYPDGENLDPAIIVRVKAYDPEDKPRAYYAIEELTINITDGSIDLFENYHMEFPDAIPYENNGNNSYDIVDQFKVMSNDNPTEELDEEVFWLQFLDKDPGEIGPTGNFEEHDVLNEDGTLRLDHIGRYWVVVNAEADSGYRGGLIESFELTKAENYYVRRPRAINNIFYDGESHKVVTAGEAKSGTLQYRITGNGISGDAWTTEIPTAVDAGNYTVYYKVEGTGDAPGVPEGFVNVTINRQLIDIELDSSYLEKVYGEPDPGLNDALDESIRDKVRITREAGEDVGEYRLYARTNEWNYAANLITDRLIIHRATHKLIASATNITLDISGDASGNAVEFETDVSDEDVNVESSDDQFAKVEKNGSTITILPVALGEATITLKIEGSENYEETTESINVKVTNKICEVSGDASSVSAADNDTIKKLYGATMSIEDAGISADASITKGKNFTNPKAIELSGNSIDYSDTKMVVRIKVANEDIKNGVAPTAYCLDASGSATDIISDDDCWYETVGDDTFICFKTTHLSNWIFTATPAINLSECHFNFDNKVFSYTGNELNLMNSLVDVSGNPIDSRSYKLVDVSGNAVNIKDCGTYTIKAVALKNRGCVNETETITFEIREIIHSFKDEWSYDSNYHWHECSGDCGIDNCGEISGNAEHEFNQEKKEDKYLASPATCTTDAKYYYLCECGAVSDDTYTDPGSAKGHDLKLVNKLPATMDEAGIKAHYECAVCGMCFKDEAGKEPFTNDEMRIPSQKEVITNGIIVAGKVVVGATVATVAIIKTVDTLVKEAEAAKKAEEAAKILEEAKATAKEALGEALGESTDPVIGAYFDEGFEAVTAAETPDEVLEATVKYVNLINEAKTVVETKIKLNKPTAQKNGKIKLTFENPGLNGVVSYHVERSTKKDFSKNLKTHKVKAADKDTLVYTNTKNLKKGTKYYYQVYAKIKLSDGNVVETNLSNVKSAKCKRTR